METIPEVMCDHSFVNNLMESSGYISSYMVSRNVCGKHWRIIGLPGQRIDITLLEFGSTITTKCNSRGFVDTIFYLYSSYSGIKKHRLFYRYVVDVNTRQNINICSDGTREHIVYSSNGNIVEITINSTSATELQNKGAVSETSEFLLQYEGAFVYYPKLRFSMVMTKQIVLGY